MRYWDASTLVPLCVAEPSSKELRTLSGERQVLTWGASMVEIACAIERRTREGALTLSQRGEAHGNLRTLDRAWLEITALAPVRERALRLLATHPLRAADAMQLGAALVAASDHATNHEFVCVDARLRAAAGREGFRIAPA